MNSQPLTNRINRQVQRLDAYATKEISLQAARISGVTDMSFGQPSFGPPEFLLPTIESEELTLPALLASIKRYEEPRGSTTLRHLIAEWYATRYGITVDPEREIMVTHGGVEAITLALLAVTEPSDSVCVCEPSYMLYQRVIQILDRRSVSVSRPAGGDEYAAMFHDTQLENVRAIIVNSPENPTGYILSEQDLNALTNVASRSGAWIIHDEVYDTMAWARPHRPCLSYEPLAANCIMVNSFSKKFGVPGMRIGWLVGPPDVIDAASKVHDYLYLGVNMLFERIAVRILSAPHIHQWLESQCQHLEERSATAIAALGEKDGFEWPRTPHGAMFLFPSVSRLFRNIPDSYRTAGTGKGAAVAQYFLHERRVSVTPGHIYGRNSDDHVRIVLCTDSEAFENGISRLARKGFNSLET